MKRFLTILSTLLVVSIFTTSCTAKIQYTVLEVGGYDYFSNADHAAEFMLATDKTAEFKLVKEKEVEYDGSKYAVTYEYTQKGYLFNSEVEYYEKQEKNRIVSFGINKKTGRVDQYSRMDKEYLDNANLTIKSKEECLTLAKNYLSYYVEDAGSYELIEDRIVELPEYDAIYDLEYARVIDGVQTSDRASINMTIYGTVIMHRFESLGEMKGAELPSQETMEAIQKDADKKLTNIYESIKEDYSVSYELDEIIFSRLEDGRYALEYFYDVQLCRLLDNARPISEMTHLIVILEK